eukprot:1159398-Pelagomonas_calceolata.AAC.5
MAQEKTEEYRSKQRVSHHGTGQPLSKSTGVGMQCAPHPHHHSFCPLTRHLLAPLHLVHRLLAEEQGRSTRRAAEALLGARVNGVHAPGIRKQWHAAQAAHRVYQEQRVGLLTDLR